jgi:hypothetical protein
MPGREGLSSVWPQFGLPIHVEGARPETPTDAQLEILTRLAARPEEVLDADKTHFVMWMEGRTPNEIEQRHTARAQSNRDLTRRRRYAPVIEGVDPLIELLSR